MQRPPLHRTPAPPVHVITIAILLGIGGLAGCFDGGEAGRNARTDPQKVTGPTGPGGGPSGPVPAELVTIDGGGSPLTFWPWTSIGPVEEPSDPINLVFVGGVEPIDVRAALVALDGDRTAAGLPPAPPFNARWSDAIGDVQTSWSESGGWAASVIQLQLGDYGPIRVHLRLFSATGGANPEHRTLGAAHFEVVIPGTADHQVLSWELAEQIVAFDLLRSGLLDPAAPAAPTPMINAVPSWRTIPAILYNALPPALAGLTGGPAAPVAADVPLGSDGRGTLLRFAHRAAIVADRRNSRLDFVYDQVIPRPFCSSGPFDWIHVAGPVTLSKEVVVGADGHYEYQSRIDGRLTIVPVDPTQNPPVLLGPALSAQVSEIQNGRLDGADGMISVVSHRLVQGGGGPQMQKLHLLMQGDGPIVFERKTRCPDAAE